MELLELSGLEQCHYNMTKRGVCVCKWVYMHVVCMCTGNMALKIKGNEPETSHILLASVESRHMRTI